MNIKKIGKTSERAKTIIYSFKNNCEKKQAFTWKDLL